MSSQRARGGALLCRELEKSCLENRDAILKQHTISHALGPCTQAVAKDLDSGPATGPGKPVVRWKATGTYPGDTVTWAVGF